MLVLVVLRMHMIVMMMTTTLRNSYKILGSSWWRVPDIIMHVLRMRIVANVRIMMNMV
jgi:hypothetical protein